ncbi:nuclear transport factor 2 family protein [uncultured Parasphingopyxis sp.]|uniref:nuclear transport factor 2 family protein n=1 Tax=uncultured Parasphingopyxis sp. TaxID=1547918 RepID=UPI0026062FE4|nr:nuclear transport factor 2 family protein [uncultured Parasphingopyxis sp.]
MTDNPNLQRWLAYIDNPDHDTLRTMLAEDAVFHSPVVHTPQAGREKVFAYLAAADHVFSGNRFEYVRMFAEGDNALLEFTAEMDGIHVNGVDIIRWNADGLIQDFKVLVRPLKAVNKVWEMMGAQLERAN